MYLGYNTFFFMQAKYINDKSMSFFPKSEVIYPLSLSVKLLSRHELSWLYKTSFYFYQQCNLYFLGTLLLRRGILLSSFDFNSLDVFITVIVISGPMIWRCDTVAARLSIRPIVSSYLSPWMRSCGAFLGLVHLPGSINLQVKTQ